METQPTDEQLRALKRAIALLGGLTEMAQAIKDRTANTARPIEPTPQNIWLWKRRGVPARVCTVIEDLTDGAIKCEELNSEIDWTFLRLSYLREAAVKGRVA